MIGSVVIMVKIYRDFRWEFKWENDDTIQTSDTIYTSVLNSNHNCIRNLPTP